MIGLSARPNQAQLASLDKKLAALVDRARTGPVHAVAGHEAQRATVAGIQSNVMRAPNPSGFPRADRASGPPLMDWRRLVRSIGYAADAQRARIGTAVPYAGKLQRGGVIRPRRQWLLLPLNPPLSPDECRSWPIGKAAIQSKYPGSFFLAKNERPDHTGRPQPPNRGGKGYPGPGVYRRVPGGIERIAAGAKKVTIRPRRWHLWFPVYVSSVVAAVRDFVFRGRPASAPPMTGGSWDVGRQP